MSDLISKQVVLKEIERLMGVYFDRKVVLSKVWDAVKALPSAQPEEDCETCKHGHFGDAQCNYCRVRYLSHYERDETGGKTMTKAEAIARIKDHIVVHRYLERNAVKILEALDMAIKALEEPEFEDIPSAHPEPCATGYIGIEDDYPVSVKQVLNITAETGALATQMRVRELPRYAQPERKKGEWIYGEHDIAMCDGYWCDQCGFFVPWDYKHKSIDFIKDYHWCPSCGADMRGKGD